MDRLPDKLSLTRRALLERSVFLVGGAAALAAFRGAPLDLQPDADGPRFFSPEQFAQLDEICEIIIPETDTPGARGVGVPALIDQMMVDWASQESRAQWLSVLDGIDGRAREALGRAFLDLDVDAREDIVRAYDKTMLNSPDTSYRRFKELVLVGYYHSEIGATQELRFELVPGAWRADVPFAEIGRSWAD